MSKIYVKNAGTSSIYFDGTYKVAGQNMVVEVEETAEILSAISKGRLQKVDKEAYLEWIEGNKPKVDPANILASQKLPQPEVRGSNESKGLIVQAAQKGLITEVKGGWFKFGKETLGQGMEKSVIALDNDPTLIFEITKAIAAVDPVPETTETGGEGGSSDEEESSSDTETGKGQGNK